MTWFRVGGAGIPATLKNAMNSVLNKKFGTSGQNYPPKQWPDDVNLLGPLPEKTASGAIATFSDGADDVPIKSLVVTIPPTLSGVSEVSETQTGKNLLNPSELVVGSINSSGENINSSTRVRSGYVKINGGQKYSVSIGGSVQIFEIHQYKADFTKAVNLISVNAQSYVLTASNDTAFIRLLMRFSNNATIAVSDITELQVQIGDTVTAYEPYNGTTHTASLGRTIYGGQADIVNGTGTETWKSVKLKDLDWTYSTAYSGFFHSASLAGTISGEDYIVISSEYTNMRLNASAIQNNDDVIDVNAENGDAVTGATAFKSIILKDSDYTTKEALVAHLTSSDSTLVYKVATPEPFTFDHVPIDSKLGNNTMWSEQGDTEVTYRADIDLALQAVSSSRGLMIASRPVTQMIGEQADLDQVNELNEEAENTEEQEGEDDAR